MKPSQATHRPYLFSILIAIAIMAVTLLPLPQPDEGAFSMHGLDKAVHFILFGSLATVWLWEHSYHKGMASIGWEAYVIAVVWVTIFGAAIEILQGLIGGTRSADFYDFIADMAGAMIVPLPFLIIINRRLPSDALRLQVLRRPSSTMHRMKQLYLDSFPPEERRHWDEIERMATDRHHPLHFRLITLGGKPCGFLTSWRFKGFRYIEHFAMLPSHRNKGVGAEALKMFVEERRTPVVVEVEPPDRSEMAARRVTFYERCGFRPHYDYRYIQPPYGSDMPSVPLMLMTASYHADSMSLKNIDRVLKTLVYRAEP